MSHIENQATVFTGFADKVYMMNILLFHPDKDIRNMISFCLESEEGFTVRQASTSQEAIDLFLEENPIDLVLTSQEPSTDKLFKYLLSTNADIPVVVLGEGFDKQFDAYPDVKVLAQIRFSEASAKLPPLLKSHFHELTKSPVHDEYCRIATSLLVRVVPLKGDIYIRLSSVKYVKLFRTGSKFTNEDLEKFLVKKKVSYLYIKRSDSQEFIQKFSQDLNALAEKAQNGDPALLDTVAEVHELILNLSNSLGFNEEVKEIAKTNVRLALKAIGTSPKLLKMLSTSQMKNKNYISSHSILLANISCSIAAQMNWPSDSTFQKLVMASLFHDVLFQDPNLAKISSKKQLDTLQSALGDEQYEFIKNHPIACAELLKGMNEVPADVNFIISQHHERPDGEGFPAGLRSHQIAPLSSVFIVAHDILDAMAEEKVDFDLQSFLKRSESVYSSGTFKQIWKSLVQLDSIGSSEDDSSAA